MVRFERVTAGAVRDLSFEVGAGEVGTIVTASQDQKNELLVLLTGLAPPAAGRVRLLGEDLYALPEPARLALFRRVGVVPEHGGLINNLKAWENILLPAAYHHGRSAAQIERAVVGLLREGGVDEAGTHAMMGRLPAGLTIHEQRLAALIRAMLMEPELMVYDSLFSGLEAGAAGRMQKLAARFHAARRGRSSLHLCPDEAAARKIRADRRARLD